MGGKGASQRQRAELTLTALLSAALGLLGPLAAGRLCWLGPVLALPAGLWLCLLWRELGREGLPRGLERAFGPNLGRLAQLLYVLWALALLIESARTCAQRMGSLLPGPGAERFYLLTALAVCLWLSRGREEIFARTGRLFFLASVAAMIFALALAVPSLDWRNLWPPERADAEALPCSALLSLSLAGYGVYALCLPRREGEEKRHWPWAAWGSVGLAWLLLTVAGAFGPKLTAELEEPFFMVLQGVEVPGAFRRGEAALAAVLTLADFVLLALLSRGCRSLWERAAPEKWGWAGYLLAAGAFLAAAGKDRAGAALTGWLPAGNLIFGTVLPALAVWGIKVRGSKKGQPIFSAAKTVQKADVGEKMAGKKSQKENEKKC